MRRLTQVLLAVCAVAVLVGVASAASVIGEPSLVATIDDRSVGPGEDTTINVTLANQGEIDTAPSSAGSLTQRVTTARAVRAQLNPADAPLTVHTDRRTLGSLSEGGSAPLPFSVSVDDDAEPGTYEMNVRVWYRYIEEIDLDTGDYDESDRFRILTVRVRVEEEPRFRVENVTGTVPEGSEEDVTVAITNTGGTAASDASLSLQSGGDLTLGESARTTRHVGVWASGETREFNLTVGASPETSGTGELTGRVNYEDSDGIPGQSERLSIPVDVTADRRFAIENVTSTLEVGAEGSLSGDVRNTGDRRVENVELALPIESETVTPVDATAAVGDLAPGERAGFEFRVDVSEDGSAGPRQFTIQPSYRTEAGSQRTGQSAVVRVPVEESVERFAVETDDATVEDGDSTRITLGVTNTGSEPVRRVSAQLFADSPISTTDKRAYVDSLAPGETEELTFGIAAEGALPKAYPLSVDFEYEDSEGDTELSDTYSVAAQVTEPDDSGPPILAVLAGFGVLGAV
ncbi:MAG: COG1361 S-layer family protein, partial [Halococcoides sp.]